MKSRRLHFDWKWAVRIFLVVAIVALIFPEQIRQGYEVVSTRLLPDAQREFQYGQRHFNAADPVAYNVDLAEYFYRQAERHNPSIPYLYHELARISFLRGRFEQALLEINHQIQRHGDRTPNSYYMRALIAGYKGDYDIAIRDYEYFLKLVPTSWATANDYAWVLLKADKPEKAAKVTGDLLKVHPENPWLLSTHAIALYEMGDLHGALRVAKEALAASAKITEAQWLKAYPGNDPRTAQQGIETHRTSIEDNIHKIEIAIAEDAIQ